MLYILVPVHDRRASSEAFARALAGQTVDQFRVVLIDDGSRDGTAAAVCAILPHTVVIRGQGHWWWGGALHQGWNWLGAQNLGGDDVVMICNDDVELPPDFLGTGLALLAEHPASLVVAKSKDAATGAVVESCFAVDYPRCRVELAHAGETVACAPTRGLFIRWSDMRRVGGFHPHLLPHYLSDLEWTMRARRRGLAIVRDDRFWLVADHARTGLHSLAGMPLGQRIKALFSYRYAGNPLHWFAFIMLAFSLRDQPSALARRAYAALCAVRGR